MGYAGLRRVLRLGRIFPASSCYDQDTLVSQGRASEEQLQRALEVQRSDPREFWEILVSLGVISETDLAQAQRLALFYVEFDIRDIDPDVIGLVPEKELRKYGVVPLRSENGRLFVAMSDPTNVPALEELSKTSGYAVVPVVATVEDIRRTQTQLYGAGDQRHVRGGLGSRRSYGSGRVGVKLRSPTPMSALLSLSSCSTRLFVPFLLSPLLDKGS